MSVASERGRNFELKIARIIRKKLGSRVARDSRSGAGYNKSDLSNYYKDIPFFIECKDQSTLKIKEWFRDVDNKAQGLEIPTLVFKADENILATLRLEDLLNLLAELKDSSEKIKSLTRSTSGFCNNGHVADTFGYCVWKKCKFSRGYKEKKGKK